MRGKQDGSYLIVIFLPFYSLSVLRANFELECLPLYLPTKPFTIDFWGELANENGKRKGYMDCSPVRIVRGAFFMSETHTSEVERVFLK